MSNKFPEDERDKIRERLIGIGFDLLRKGGIKAVNIDVLTEQCFIAKGTFYRIFPQQKRFPVLISGAYQQTIHIFITSACLPMCLL